MRHSAILLTFCLLSSCNVFNPLRASFSFDESLGTVRVGNQEARNSQDLLFYFPAEYQVKAATLTGARSVFSHWYWYYSVTIGAALSGEYSIEPESKIVINCDAVIFAYFDREVNSLLYGGAGSDGKIIFLSNKSGRPNIYRMNADGTAKQSVSQDKFGRVWEITDPRLFSGANRLAFKISLYHDRFTARWVDGTVLMDLSSGNWFSLSDFDSDFKYEGFDFRKDISIDLTGKYLAANEKTKVVIYDLEAGEKFSEYLPSDGETVKCLEYSHEGRLYFVLSRDEVDFLAYWDPLSGGSGTACSREWISGFMLSPDGILALLYDIDAASAWLVDTASGSISAEYSDFAAVREWTSGGYLVIGKTDGTEVLDPEGQIIFETESSFESCGYIEGERLFVWNEGRPMNHLGEAGFADAKAPIDIFAINIDTNMQTNLTGTW